MITTVTVDFWGTLLLDPPSSDDRYRRRRLADFATILAGAGVEASRSALERGYAQSGAWLGRLWADSRDVPVTEHVRAILAAVDPALPARLPPDVLAALVDAYARPALLVPPPVDPGARGALEALEARGCCLAVVSNTMRTPGATLRLVLERHGLLRRFAVTTFSDETGVRKPAPDIFLRTLRALGAEPQSAVHVGDDALLDVHGARAAGMRAIQVGGAAAAGAPRPDAVIRGLAELPAAVERLDR
ncbi:MAG TPA: HAD family hydrolase [Methylomirabilota bacterium]|nr:HAD family hydrolase [Methylomirabilota bacterium]